MHTHVCLYSGVCLSSRRFLSGEFCPRFLSGRFVRGGFCPSPILSEYILYNRKTSLSKLGFIITLLKVFSYIYMYEKTFKIHDTNVMLLDPPPVKNCNTFSDPSPSSAT